MIAFNSDGAFDTIMLELFDTINITKSESAYSLSHKQVVLCWHPDFIFKIVFWKNKKYINKTDYETIYKHI